MSTRGDILRRAAQVEPDAVPEPWRASDDEDALATVSDREHYRKNLVMLPDGAGEVPAYVWDFPRTATIPDEVREEWTRGSAGRVLNAQGKYVSRGSDVPRLSYDGETPGLLVEAAGRTNHVLNSSDASQWITLNSASVSATSTSIIKGETAHEVTGGGNNFDLIQEDAGTFSGSQEVVAFWAEKGTSPETNFVIRDKTSQDSNIVRLDWSSESLSNPQAKFGSIDRTDLRVLNVTPNGRKTVVVVIAYTPATQGNNRVIQFHPDPVDNDDSAILHHAQIEEAPNASSPIVTQGSPTTRSADGYAIQKGDWWNTKEGTFIFEFVPQLFYQPFDLTQFGFLDSQGVPASYLNIYWADNPAPFQIQVQHNRSTSNRTAAPVQAPAFQKSKFACSFSDSGRLIVSLNGQSKTRQNTKATDPLLEEKDIQIGDESFVRYAGISYRRRALPESTLNQITS